MKTSLSGIKYIINFGRKAKTASVICFLSFCSLWTTANAEIYKITLEANVLQQFPQFAMESPLQGLSRPNSLVSASFLLDFALGHDFGYSSCCNAIGYSISDVKITFNGVEQPNWVSGIHNRPFTFSGFDLHEGGFFTGIDGEFWLPLNNTMYPSAQIDFGQMYISGGGLNFYPSNQFTARASYPNGGAVWGGSAITLLQPVPEPEMSAMMVAGLAILMTLIRRRRCVAPNLESHQKLEALT